MHGKYFIFPRTAVGTLLLALTVYLGFWVERSQTLLLLSAYGLFFAGYTWVLLRSSRDDRNFYVGIGIALRVVLLFSIPNLSDDFYRFLWDGRLAAQGIHPFAHPPAFFMENATALRGITPELFQKLNSPEYHTVYPPVCQAVFWLAAKLFPESIAGGVFILKLFLFVCELGTLAVLAKFGEKSALPEKSPFPHNLVVVAYALNPLILLEITGNCHFEGAMLFFLLAGIFALARRQITLAALFWALATASKLLPLLFLPIVWTHLGWRAGLRFVTLFAVFCAALFWPLLDLEVLTNMAGSLNLYFQQFAFNASAYYVLCEVVQVFAPPTLDVGRTLGPILGIVVFVGVLVLAFWKRKQTTQVFHQNLLLASTLYLALATTVHPWYIALPFGLGLLTSWRFSLVWTGAAFLSYSHYSGGDFQENYGLIVLEYGLVLWAVWQDWTRVGHRLN